MQSGRKLNSFKTHRCPSSPPHAQAGSWPLLAGSGCWGRGLHRSHASLPRSSPRVSLQGNSHGFGKHSVREQFAFLAPLQRSLLHPSSIFLALDLLRCTGWAWRAWGAELSEGELSMPKTSCRTSWPLGGLRGCAGDLGKGSWGSWCCRHAERASGVQPLLL